jgi:hypothetical protein
MCCVTRADLQPGAYLTHPDGLFHVDALRPGRGGVSEVLLTDAGVPLTTERLPDPGTPGRLGRSLVLDPKPTVLPMHKVLRDFDLLRHAPCPADVATPAEWGSADTTGRAA